MERKMLILKIFGRFQKHCKAYFVYWDHFIFAVFSKHFLKCAIFRYLHGVILLERASQVSIFLCSFGTCPQSHDHLYFSISYAKSSRISKNFQELHFIELLSPGKNTKGQRPATKNKIISCCRGFLELSPTLHATSVLALGYVQLTSYKSI